MKLRASALAVLLGTAVPLGGCSKEKQEPPPTEDRTLAKLRQEVDRVNQGGAPNAGPEAPVDPNARLAGLAAQSDGDSVKMLPLVSHQSVKVDTLALQPVSVESMHSLRGTGKVGLTTSDLFLRVTLAGRNVGEQPLDVTLSKAQLVDAQEQHYPIARDAQTVGGTRALDHTWASDQSESLVLLFEVPTAAVAPGLTLLVSPRGGTDARIPLQ